MFSEFREASKENPTILIPGLLPPTYLDTWLLMIRFHDGNDFFELDLTNQESEPLPAAGDAYLTLKVSSSGFEGHNDLWVDAKELQTFCCDLLRLAADRKSSAKLEGLSPNELKVTVRSVDSFGHMVVEGITGFQVFREHGAIWHSVSFGFEFDPSQLNEVERNSWVKANAEN